MGGGNPPPPAPGRPFLRNWCWGGKPEPQCLGGWSLSMDKSEGKLPEHPGIWGPPHFGGASAPRAQPGSPSESREKSPRPTLQAEGGKGKRVETHLSPLSLLARPALRGTREPEPDTPGEGNTHLRPPTESREASMWLISQKLRLSNVIGKFTVLGLEREQRTCVPCVTHESLQQSRNCEGGEHLIFT